LALPLIWLGGDLYKLSYYAATKSPIALQLCAAFQIFTDLCILAQFSLYRNRSSVECVKADSKVEENEKANN
jgi:hypothetical protein